MILRKVSSKNCQAPEKFRHWKRPGVRKALFLSKCLQSHGFVKTVAFSGLLGARRDDQRTNESESVETLWNRVKPTLTPERLILPHRLGIISLALFTGDSAAVSCAARGGRVFAVLRLGRRQLSILERGQDIPLNIPKVSKKFVPCRRKRIVNPKRFLFRNHQLRSSKIGKVPGHRRLRHAHDFNQVANA